MSILPHINQGSTSSSSSSSDFQNPNFNHGNFTINDQQQQQQHHHQQQFEQPNMASLRISEGQSSSSMLNSLSDSVAETAADSGGSSKKVTGYRNSNGWKKPSNQNLNDRVQPHSIAQGGVGSPESGGEVSHSPPNGRGSGSARRRSQIPNGNHLLNFQFNPIARSQPRAPPLTRKPQKIKPYNKDLFLQANYRFVVLNSGNYSLESMDPDKTLLWEDIICVKYSTPHPVQCPICLDDPLCPQITSCGHIFCFPCILQYLLMGEDNHKAECWRKCPLCFMMISSKDMYTIYIENVGEHNVGDTIDFMLLTRKKDSFSLHEQHKGESAKTRDSFSKFTLTLDVDLSVREAMSALDSWLVRADSGLVDDIEKLPYVCAAMEHLEQRKQYWNARRVSASSLSCKTVDCKGVCDEDPKFEDGVLSPFDNTTKIIDTLLADIPRGSSLVQSSDTDESQEGQGSLESNSMQTKVDVSGDPKDRDAYNFYQAVDGQPIVLHPLNMKCLLHHYGSYEQLPSRLSGKIIHLESITQSEAMRRRYRYLSHFPLTTTFQLCEIDIREILPPEALSPFIDEIKKREKQRKWLAKKEREDQSKAEAIAAYSLPIPYNMVQSSFDGPSAFSMDDFEALGNSTPTVASSPPVQGGRQLFANVARLGFAAGGDSPSLSRQETSTQPTPESSSNAGPAQAIRSFANVISREASTATSDTRKTIEAGKKGKKQNRVLLSTAGGRRY